MQDKPNMATTAQGFADLATTMRDVTETAQRFQIQWRKGVRLATLRNKAEHFATPSWQRPFHRLRVRYFLWRHYRHDL